MFKSALIVLTLGIIGIVIAVLAVTTQNPFSQPKVGFQASPETIVQELRQLNRLETASYTIEKVIEGGTQGNQFQEILYGDRILLIAHGQVIAGFDLSKLQPQDLKVNQSQIIVRLPAPEILTTALDNEQTRVYDRKLGLLSRGNKDLETATRAEAEKMIETAACQGMILDKAAESGRTQLTALLSALGFSDVTIEIPVATCE
jgi:hypothetical protein